MSLHPVAVREATAVHLLGNASQDRDSSFRSYHNGGNAELPTIAQPPSVCLTIVSNRAQVLDFLWLPHDTPPARAPSSNVCHAPLAFSRSQLPGIGLGEAGFATWQQPKLNDERVGMMEKEACIETGFWFCELFTFLFLPPNYLPIFLIEFFFSDGRLCTFL
ncbi:hypothetical protein DL96DRAFT_557335 [Flagelloscypha sp. PMI_526]|nr:hypothetical protein DL96DRAFT_557335 [Flagelloscypha sp. PMI_526]